MIKTFKRSAACFFSRHNIGEHALKTALTSAAATVSFYVAVRCGLQVDPTSTSLGFTIGYFTGIRSSDAVYYARRQAWRLDLS